MKLNYEIRFVELILIIRQSNFHPGVSKPGDRCRLRVRASAGSADESGFRHGRQKG